MFKIAFFSFSSHTRHMPSRFSSCSLLQGVWLWLSKTSKRTYGQPQAPMLKVDGFLPMGLFKSNFVMFLKPCHSQTSHGHIHSVQRISVRPGLSQYPFVNLVGKSSALECLFSGLGGKTHTEGHTSVYACTFFRIFFIDAHIRT